MRIVAGKWKGRTLLSPSGPVRPTAEELRDAWLTPLQAELDGDRRVRPFHFPATMRTPTQLTRQFTITSGVAVATVP